MKKGLKPGKRKRRRKNRPSDKDISFLLGGLAGYLFGGVMEIEVEDETEKQEPIEVEFEIVEDEE